MADRDTSCMPIYSLQRAAQTATCLLALQLDLMNMAVHSHLLLLLLLLLLLYGMLKPPVAFVGGASAECAAVRVLLLLLLPFLPMWLLQNSC